MRYTSSTMRPTPPRARAAWYAAVPSVGSPRSDVVVPWAVETIRLRTSTSRRRSGEKSRGNLGASVVAISQVLPRARCRYGYEFSHVNERLSKGTPTGCQCCHSRASEQRPSAANVRTKIPFPSRRSPAPRRVLAACQFTITRLSRRLRQDLEIDVVVLLNLGQGLPEGVEIPPVDGFDEGRVAVLAIVSEERDKQVGVLLLPCLLVGGEPFCQTLCVRHRTLREAGDLGNSRIDTALGRTGIAGTERRLPGKEPSMVGVEG